MPSEKDAVEVKQSVFSSLLLKLESQINRTDELSYDIDQISKKIMIKSESKSAEEIYEVDEGTIISTLKTYIDRLCKINNRLSNTRSHLKEIFE